MKDVESEYLDYERAKRAEGGLHTGRSTPRLSFFSEVLIVLILIGILGGAIVAAVW